MLSQKMNINIMGRVILNILEYKYNNIKDQ